MSSKGTNKRGNGVKENLGSLDDEKGETIKAAQDLESDPTLMTAFVDQVERIENETYSSADVSMSKTSSSGTIAEPNKDLELIKYLMDSTSAINDNPYSMSQVSMPHSAYSSYAGLRRLLAGLVVAGIIILAVVLLFVFLC